ncbi:MAG: M23 family metallopeptidase [Terrimesophilobacter sp.]
MPQPLEDVLRLPGLSGRSVRRLQHLQAVRFLRRAISVALGACAVIVAVTLGLPAYAQAIAQPEFTPPPQALTVSSTANISTVERDGYSVTAPPPLQWPTVLHTKISDGYGARVSPCDGCSSMHAGVDFDSGRGSEVRSIAAGVVIKIGSPATSSLGNFVMIEHQIDGQIVSSVYAHLEDGSISMSVGDTVTVGQLVGLIGSTGATTGAHLHFELLIDGSHVNPVEWLRAHIK